MSRRGSHIWLSLREMRIAKMDRKPRIKPCTGEVSASFALISVHYVRITDRTFHIHFTKLYSLICFWKPSPMLVQSKMFRLTSLRPWRTAWKTRWDFPSLPYTTTITCVLKLCFFFYVGKCPQANPIESSLKAIRQIYQLKVNLNEQNELHEWEDSDVGCTSTDWTSLNV